jgi:hypothetical protein
MADSPMPPDPFSPALPDLSVLAAGNYNWFAAHLAAGFSEAQAMHLTTTYATAILSVIMAGPAPAEGGGV